MRIRRNNMKKRILSFLLLLAMVLTALPAFALPALAGGETGTGTTEGRMYEAGDYNALYVSEGLLWGYDFYQLNLYWKSTIPTEVSTATFQDYHSLIGSLGTGTGVQVRTVQKDGVTHRPFTYEAGYIQFLDNQDAGAYLEFGVRGIGVFAPSTMQIVASPVGVAARPSYPFIFRGTSVMFEAAGEGQYKIAPGQYQVAASVGYDGVTSIPESLPKVVYDETKFASTSIALGAIGDFTFYTPGIKSLADDGEDTLPNWGDGTNNALKAERETALTLKYGTTTLVDDAKVTFQHQRATIAAMTILGYNQTSKMAMYAARAYSGTLTDEQIKQNHFADLAKWFRLDIGGFSKLSDSEKAQVYDAVQAFTFDSDKAAVQAAVDAVYYNRFASLTDILGTLFATAKKYHLDLEIFGMFPIGYLSNTVKFLQTLQQADQAGTAGTADEIAAAYLAEQEKDINAYANRSTLQAGDYDRLYVRNDLIAQFDFFSTNQYWNNASGGDFTTGTAAKKANYEAIGALRYSNHENADYGGGAVKLEDGVMRFPAYTNSYFRYSTRINPNTSDTSSEITTEYVLKYAGQPKSEFFYGQKRWLSTGGSYSDENGATLKITTLRTNTNTYYYNTDKSQWGSFSTWRVMHSFTEQPTYQAGRRAVTLTNTWNSLGYYTIPAADAMPDYPMSVMYAVDRDEPIYTLYGNVNQSASNYYYGEQSDYIQNPNWEEGQPEKDKYIPNPDKPSGLLVRDDAYAEHLVGYSNSFQGDVYAIRQYTRVLSQAESRQNHFADLAKYFRINLGDFNALMASKSPEERDAFYKAFRGLDMATSNRVEVQGLYVALTRDEYNAPYAAMVANDPAHAGFYEVAQRYALDVRYLATFVVPAAAKVKDALAAKITDASLLGKNPSEAQAILENAFDLTSRYLIHAVEGDTALTAFLTAAHDKGLNITALMAIPYGERPSSELSALTTQEEIDAYVATKMTKYGEIKTYTPDDYHALYVQKGLALAADWFRYNTYWGEALPEMPEPPHQWTYGDPFAMQALGLTAIPEGKQAGDLIFPNPEDRVNGDTVTSDFQKAVNAYRKAYNDILAKGRVLSNNGGLNLNLVSMGSASWKDRTGELQITPFKAELGYLKFDDKAPGGSYVSISPNGAPATTQTVQQILRPGSVLNSNTSFITMGAAAMMAQAANGEYYLKNGVYQSTIQYTAPAEPLVTFRGDRIADFTMRTTHPAFNVGNTLNGAEGGSVSIRYNTTFAIPEATLNYTGATQGQIQNSVIGYTNGLNGQLFALRVYTRDITNEEIAQNHFVDLAKWFRLDIGQYLAAPDSVKALIHAAVAEFNFDDTPAAITAAISAVIRDAVYSEYYITDEIVAAGVYTQDEANLINRYIDLAADCGTDISRVVILPKDYLMQVINGLDEIFANNAVSNDLIVSFYLNPLTDAAYNAIKTAVGDSLTPKTYTAEQYRQLYARQDRLLLLNDFFSSSEEIGLPVTGEEPIQSIYANKLTADTPESEVFRYGITSFSNNKLGGVMRGENVGDRAFKDGYFFTKGHANLRFFSYQTEGQQGSVQSSDYTFEFVYNVVPAAGSNTATGGNLQLDGTRFVSGLRDGVFNLDFAVTENHYKPTQNGDGIAKGSTTLSNPEKGQRFQVPGGTAHSVTYALHKDLSSHPVFYYKLTWNGSTYASYDATQKEISEAEARTLYGDQFDADFTSQLDALAVKECIIKDCASQANGKPVKLMACRYPATMDYKTYLDGNLAHNRTGRMYPAGDAFLFGIGSSTDINWYSVRQYDVVLTQDEILQNHFVDVARYYGLDLTLYLALDTEGRAAVHTAMKGIQVAGNPDEALAAYRTALAATYYEGLKIAIPGSATPEQAATIGEYNRMIELCGKYGLNVSAFADRSEVSRLAYAEVLNKYASDGVYVAEILQLDLNQAVAPDATLEELARNLFIFEGYSVRLHQVDETKRYPGVRAVYKINGDVLATLTEKYGTALTFGVHLTGDTTHTLTAYENGAYLEGFKFLPDAQDGSKQFAVTLVFAEENEQTKAMYERAYTVKPFVKVSETEEATYTSVSKGYEDGLNAAKAYKYALDYPEYNEDATVRQVLTTVNGTAPVTMKLDDVNVAQYTIVYDNRYTKAEAEAIAAVIAEKTGGVNVSLIEQGAMKSPVDHPKTKAIWLRAPDRCGELQDGAYGIMTQSGAVVLTATFTAPNGNTAEGLAAAFSTYLESNKAEDGSYIISSPAELTSLTPAPAPAP